MAPGGSERDAIEGNGDTGAVRLRPSVRQAYAKRSGVPVRGPARGGAGGAKIRTRRDPAKALRRALPRPAPEELLDPGVDADAEVETSALEVLHARPAQRDDVPELLFEREDAVPDPGEEGRLRVQPPRLPRRPPAYRDAG